MDKNDFNQQLIDNKLKRQLKKKCMELLLESEESLEDAQILENHCENKIISAEKQCKLVEEFFNEMTQKSAQWFQKVKIKFQTQIRAGGQQIINDENFQKIEDLNSNFQALFDKGDYENLICQEDQIQEVKKIIQQCTEQCQKSNQSQDLKKNLIAFSYKVHDFILQESDKIKLIAQKINKHQQEKITIL